MERAAKAWSYVRPISPMEFIGPLDYETIPLLFLYGIIGIVCFLLSVRCYKEHDDTPAGLRVLYGLVAAGWNLLYLAYYFLRASMGYGC